MVSEQIGDPQNKEKTFEQTFEQITKMSLNFADYPTNILQKMRRLAKFIFFQFYCILFLFHLIFCYLFSLSFSLFDFTILRSACFLNVFRLFLHP